MFWQTIWDDIDQEAYHTLPIVSSTKDVVLIDNYYTDTNFKNMMIDFFPHKIILNYDDCFFLNYYYRKLLRVKLEQDFLSGKLETNTIITSYTTEQIDRSIIKALRLFKILCNYLNIPNTYCESIVNRKLFYNRTFWSSMADKFIDIFGENVVSNTKELESEMNDYDYSFQVIIFLHAIFDRWSNTRLHKINNREFKFDPDPKILGLLGKLKQ